MRLPKSLFFIFCVFFSLSQFTLHATGDYSLQNGQDPAKTQQEGSNSTESIDYLYDLSVVAIFQNEAPYLREWIEFHKLVGVQHFYLYNNLSDDNYFQVLEPYINSGEVELTEWKYDCRNLRKIFWTSTQINAYEDACKKSLRKTKWLAVIDLDEFLVPVQKSDLIQLLAEFEDQTIGSMCANWQMYGTSRIPQFSSDRLMIEELLFKGAENLNENKFVKSIVRPERMAKMGVHTGQCLKPFTCVTPDKKQRRGIQQPITIDKIRINHYWTRDEEYCFTNKISRLKSTTKWKKEEQVLEMLESLNQEYDPIMMRFIPQLRERMGMGAGV